MKNGARKTIRLAVDDTAVSRRIADSNGEQAAHYDEDNVENKAFTAFSHALVTAIEQELHGSETVINRTTSRTQRYSVV